MDDADFEAALAAAFQTPAQGVQRLDMTETILQRVNATTGPARACWGALA